MTVEALRSEFLCSLTGLWVAEAAHLLPLRESRRDMMATGRTDAGCNREGGGGIIAHYLRTNQEQDAPVTTSNGHPVLVTCRPKFEQMATFLLALIGSAWVRVRS